MKRLFHFSLLAALIVAIGWTVVRERRAAEATQAESPPRRIQFVDIGEPETADRTPLDRRADVAAPPREGGSIVRGRCTDPRGEPLEDVEVSCAFPPAIATTDSEGRFELALASVNSDPIHAMLRAHRPGLGVLWTETNIVGGSSVTLADWRLTPAVVLRGRVSDADGARLSGIEVRCTSSEFVCEGACYTPRGAALCVASTDANGAFEILDAPAGDLCVWAGADGRTLWVSSSPFRAAPGATVENLEFVTPRVARENLLGVRVLSPDGEPVAGARIDYRFHSRSAGGSGAGVADDEGVWILEVLARAPHHVLATDPEGRWRPTLLRGAQPGVLDAPLALAPSKRIGLRVADPDGRPVESFALRLVEATGDELAPGVPVDPIVLVDTALQEHAAGLVTLQAPTIPFLIHVAAPGWMPLESGPFDADVDASEIALTVRPYPGVEGVVRFEGAPAGNAKVTLHRAASDPRQARYGETIAEANTDSHGRFRLACGLDGEFWVRASRAEAADTDLGPFDCDARLGVRDLALELTRGGTIEGVAPPAHGESAAGASILASRGDGRTVMASTDSEGAFRFTRMTPGPWVVERRVDSTPSNTAEGARPSASVLCEVAVGRTTQVELAAPDAHLSVLRGRLALGGAPANGWLVTIGTKTAVANEQGEFEVAGLASGSVRIGCAPTGGASGFRLDGEFILREGPNELVLDLPIGRIQGRVRDANAASGSLEWSWAGDGVWSARGSTKLDAEGAFVVLRAPAGRITLSTPSSTTAGGATALSIQVDATTTVDVEL